MSNIRTYIWYLDREIDDEANEMCKFRWLNDDWKSTSKQHEAGLLHYSDAVLMICSNIDKYD